MYVPGWVVFFAFAWLASQPGAFSGIWSSMAIVLALYALYYLVKGLCWLLVETARLVIRTNWLVVVRNIGLTIWREAPRVAVIMFWVFIVIVLPAIAFFAVSMLFPKTLFGALLPGGWFVYMSALVWFDKRREKRRASMQTAA